MPNTQTQDLLLWYDRNRRDLPWRAKPGAYTPAYRVWLSEIMLQQTTVQAVKPYFAKFLTLWPTVEVMAAAPLDDILANWAGLGYYARARNLHKCATTVVQTFGGRFPTEVADLLTLPGIGDYTANAIASIAFDTPAVVVDGNVERVIARYHRVKTPLPKAKTEIRALTHQIAPETSDGRPGDFAQAMMDLGATICTPKDPKCLLCPWQSGCAAHKAGDMTAYPVKLPKKPKPTRRTVAFWLQADDHILLERRPAKGLLGGMPGLFSTPWIEQDTIPEDWQALAPTKGAWAIREGETKHTFTHFHLITKVAMLRLHSRINTDTGYWHPLSDLSALPTVFSKMAALAQNSAD